MKEIIIETPVDFTDGREVMTAIRNNLTGKISFSGWAGGVAVIQVDGVDYKVKPYKDGGLKLQETKQKTAVPIREAKQKAEEEYKLSLIHI